MASFNKVHVKKLYMPNAHATKKAFGRSMGQVTATADELNIMDGVTATAAELNIMDGVTATTAEINQWDASANNALMTQGSGFTLCDSIQWSVINRGGIVTSQCLIDIDGLNSGGTANDLIGDAAAANCWFGRITTAINGVIYEGKMDCLETPTGGDDDINLNGATTDAGTEDVALTGIQEFIDAGNSTTGSTDAMTDWPANNEYLYLTGGVGDKNATYTAGILLITMLGYIT
jgi:hypothetical protein